jgi:hypothetical protein
MAPSKLVGVLFHKPALPYQPGDHAAFTETKAKHFVEIVKVADYATTAGEATDKPVEAPRRARPALAPK